MHVLHASSWKRENQSFIHLFLYLWRQEHAEFVKQLYLVQLHFYIFNYIYWESIISLNAYSFFFTPGFSIKSCYSIFAIQFPPDLIFSNARWWFLNLSVMFFNSALIKAVESPHLLCSVRAEHMLKPGASLTDWRLWKEFHFHLSFMTQHD